ncbi:HYPOTHETICAL PROTEIN MCJ_000110 [Mesomycoplasma conjunctivae]|uniref:Uncharacterized protein n=1 Tax=Mesomycoplasma conjunctivae (strain ATCC 25834 / NCTC 10147 / HRC/581) TaxID=572263 RepID=C5J5G8_MESCH|nr:HYPOTHETICAL PROTEIN MCJ_000110 [Mesomycoplasma conjunctivae]
MANHSKSYPLYKQDYLIKIIDIFCFFLHFWFFILKQLFAVNTNIKSLLFFLISYKNKH